MLLQIFAGTLYALSFKPVGLWIFAPIALSLEFYLLRKYRFPVIQSFIFASFSSLIILSWSKTFVGVAPWIALALLQGLLALPVGLVARYSKNVPTLIFTVLLMEEIRARFPFGGFSWTRIGFSQVESPYLPIVPITGVIGLSFITLVIAATILSLNQRGALVLIAILATVHLIPTLHESTETISIRAIQGGVPERGLNFNSRAQAVLDNHIDITVKEFSKEDDLILWPENAVDIDPFRNRVVSGKIEKLATLTGKPLIAGAILDDKKVYNSTVLFNGNGEPISTYIKRYLTPFGEFIPMRTVASLFSPHVDRVTDFSPGHSSVIHQLSNARVGSVICYELLNDGIVRVAASHSDFLVVHTNSATFSGSSEGEQQLAITRLRAIESGKAVVSISTTGPSAIISARGEVLEKLDDGEVGSLSADIPLIKSLSIAHSFGGYGVLLVLLFAFIWATTSVKESYSPLSRRERKR